MAFQRKDGFSPWHMRFFSLDEDDGTYYTYIDGDYVLFEEWVISEAYRGYVVNGNHAATLPNGALGVRIVTEYRPTRRQSQV